MATTYTKGKLYLLKIADLQPDPNQARKFMDPVAVNELAASILKLGVMVPIQFRRDEQGALVIVSGHRRVTAAGKAGLTDIYGTFTDGDTRMQGFVENLQRENLAPVDEAEQMAALMKEYVFNQYQLADALGKSQAAVSDNNEPEQAPGRDPRRLPDKSEYTQRDASGSGQNENGYKHAPEVRGLYEQGRQGRANGRPETEAIKAAIPDHEGGRSDRCIGRTAMERVV
jgi:ParB/RepB/Spo0J family partition protein